MSRAARLKAASPVSSAGSEPPAAAAVARRGPSEALTEETEMTVAAFPTLTAEHPHNLRTMVRHIETGRLYLVLAMVIWTEAIDQCDEIIAAPVDDLSTWDHFLEFELEVA